MEILPRTTPTIEAELEPGYVFQPSDEELAVDYLHSWITKKRVPCDIVILDDIYRIEPWLLLGIYKRKVEGYFLVRVTEDSRTGARKKRTCGEGSYAIQKRNDGNGTMDGTITWCKSTFSYHCMEEGERKRKRKSSGWVMHEYELTSLESEWVLCRVKMSDQEISRRKRTKREEETDSDTYCYSSGVEQEQQGKDLLVSTSSDGDPPNLQVFAEIERWLDADCEEYPLEMVNIDDLGFLEMGGLLDCSISGTESEEEHEQQQQQQQQETDSDTYCYSSGVEYEQQGKDLLVSSSSDGDPPNLQIFAEIERWLDADCEEDPLTMVNLDDLGFLEMGGLLDCSISGTESAEEHEQQQQQQETDSDSDTYCYSSGIEYEQQGKDLLVSSSSDGDPPNLQIFAEIERWLDADCEEDPLTMVNLDDLGFLEMDGLLDCSISGLESEEEHEQQQEVAAYVGDDPLLAMNLDYFLDLDMGFDEGMESARIDQVAEQNQEQKLMEVGRDEEQEEDLMLTFDENPGELDMKSILAGVGPMDLFEDYC